VVVITGEHSAWHAPSGRTENCGAAFEQFVLRIQEHDSGIELAAGMSYGPHDFDFAARRNGKPLLVDAKQTTPQTPRRIKQLGDQLKSAAARYSRLHQEAVPELALACAEVLPNRSETVPHGRGAAARTRQPCAGDPRWARRVANAVLILRVLMLQCRNVTGESLERPGSLRA
jgi:hypothetical protein